MSQNLPSAAVVIGALRVKKENMYLLQLRLEVKIGAIGFAVLGLVKPAYYIFKFVRVSKGSCGIRDAG